MMTVYFLVDLALNHAEREAVKDKDLKNDDSVKLSANTAINIIEAIKSKNNTANIKIITKNRVRGAGDNELGVKSIDFKSDEKANEVQIPIFTID